MDINKINKDMMLVLEEVQEVQSAYIFDFSMSVKILHNQKGFRIVVNFEDLTECEKSQLGLFRGNYRFECYQEKEALKEMLDDLRRAALTLKNKRTIDVMKYD